MGEQVFKPNFFVAIILPIIVSIVLIAIFFAAQDVPAWVLLFIIIPIGMILYGQRTKLIVTDDVLRYQQVFSGDEVELKKVAQIVTREVETFVESSNQRNTNQSNSKGMTLNINNNQGNQERRIEKIAYVLDDSGKTFFPFPASLIGMKNRRRFEDAITTVNPDIEVS